MFGRPGDCFRPNKFTNHGVILLEKYLWVEKYRPRTLDDMVLDEVNKHMFEKFISDKSIPNLLFIGKAGSGKTTVARILIGNIVKKEDVLILNGSSNRGIAIVRETIDEFLSLPSYSDSKIKIVYIDEFDNMMPDAHKALRFKIEEAHDIGRFIFTANYRHSILPELFSRVAEYHFKVVDFETSLKYVYSVLEKENVQFDKNHISELVKIYYPDIRRVLNMLHGFCADNKIIVGTEYLLENEDKVVDSIKNICKSLMNKDLSDIRTHVDYINSILETYDLDYNSIFKRLYQHQGIPLWAKVIMGDYCDKHLTSIVPQLPFLSMISKMTSAGKRVYNLK
jgi:DNA polymerase III delta prime subunit